MYAFLPLGLRVINKLVALVDIEMEKIQAQKMLLPALISTHLWKKTDRLNDNVNELFKVQDRSRRQYILSPVSFQSFKMENIGTRDVLRTFLNVSVKYFHRRTKKQSVLLYHQ